MSATACGQVVPTSAIGAVTGTASEPNVPVERGLADNARARPRWVGGWRLAAAMFGLSIAGTAASRSPEAGCAASAPADAVAQIEYLPALGDVLAWRRWSGPYGECTQIDWPDSERLAGIDPTDLLRLLDLTEQRRRELLTPSLPRVEVASARRDERALWEPVERVAAPDGRPPLPLCPRVPERDRMTPVELPPAVATTVLRVRPHRCQPGSAPLAGSGVLLSPQLGLTAAHVVMTPAGLVCSRYRVTPGGRRYSDPPHAPFGISFVTRAALSERGGWSLAASAAPPRERNEDARTAHDYAWLLLEEPASVPADTVWPRLRFGDPAGRIGQPVLSAGYPAQTPVARSAPGAMVALFGQLACPLAAERATRQALWLALGGSGGPIWSWYPERPLELHSLASRVEGLPGERFETLGPRFDLVDYQRLLVVLQQERERALESARRQAKVRGASSAVAIAADAARPTARRHCTINPNPDSLLGYSGLTACRVRCSVRPQSCQSAEQ